MRRKWNGTDLDGDLFFGRLLGDIFHLQSLQELIGLVAPRWCSKLRVWKSSRDQVPIDVSDPGALARAVLDAAGERGPTYEALVERYGRPPLERFSGSAELRGAGPELIVVVSVDEMVVSPLASKKLLGNSIGLQVRGSRVEGKPGAVWLRDTMRTLCERLSPVWASAQHPGEWDAKVMSDGPALRAIGVDFGRFLPGVFWLNFFGSPYRRLVGEQRLRSVPGEHVTVVDDGVLVLLSEDPLTWDTPGYAALEQRVRDHLGEQLFFSKAAPDRPGVVPDWQA